MSQKDSLAQSAGAVECTDSFSAEEESPNECPEYDTEPDEVPVLQNLWGMQSTHSNINL